MCSCRCTYKELFLKLFQKIKDVIKVIVLKEPSVIKHLERTNLNE